jgi:Ca-activated chloride channel family protein
MASDDQDKKRSGSKKLSEEDLDKTMVDVRIRDMGRGTGADTPLEKQKDLGDLDKTVMVRVDEPVEESLIYREKTPQDDLSDKTQIVRPEKILREEKKAREKEQQRQIEQARGKKEEPDKPRQAPKPPASAAVAAVAQPRSSVLFSPAYLLLTLLVFIFLGVGLLEALRASSPLRLPAMVCTAIAFLFLLGSLIKRVSSKAAFLWASVSWFAWFCFASYSYYTSLTVYFLHFSLAQVLGLFFCFASGVVAFSLLRDKSVSSLAKWPALVGFFLIALAFALSVLAGQSLETNLWGPRFVAGLPLFLRPGVLALMLGFPLQLLAVLLALPGWRGREGGMGVVKTPALALLLLCLMGSAAGAKLLSRQGLVVPLLGKLVGEGFSGSTLIDPNQTSIRLLLAQDTSPSGRDNAYSLTLAAGAPTAKDKSNTAPFLVRNLEGHPFVRADLGKHMTLVRGDLKMKGGQLSLDPERLGAPRVLVLLVDVPMGDPQVSTSIKGAVYHLAQNLNASDRLFVAGAGGIKELELGRPHSWEKSVTTALKGEAVNLPELLSEANKKLTDVSGYKQIIVVSPSGKLPDSATRTEWSEQGKKAKLVLSFLGLGPAKDEEVGIYLAPDPSALGFNILSAAASILGDYRLQFPQLPPLPKISVVLTPEGQVQIQGGKINFEVLSSEAGALQTLRFQIDNEKPIDLDPSQLSQSVDLELYKVKPGKHRFSIQMVTVAGDEILKSFEGDYVTKRPLQFVKPLDRDTIGGIVNVMFSPGRVPGMTVRSVDLFVDGIPSGVATTEPYLIGLDTGKLDPGEHKLQAVQTYSDGNTEAVELTVTVNPSAPTVKITRPGNGEFLSNVADIEVEMSGGPMDQIQKVDYYVDGQWIGESAQAPHRFLWSNHQFPVGQYFLQARVQLESKATGTDAVQVQLAQGEVVVQADSAQSTTGELFPDNLAVLLDASSSMKEPLGGSLKIDIAKSTLAGLSRTLPPNTQLFTRIFGGGASGVHGNCEDSVRLNKPAEELARVTPLGTSPLAYALMQMKGDLQKTHGSRVGLLITDGWDHCGADPIEAAQKLAKDKNKIRLEVIYFSDVSPTEESLLKRLAEVTGGRSYKVSRPEDLVEAIRNAVHVNFNLYDFKNTAVVSQPLSAQPFFIRTGEYRLEVDTEPPLVKEGLKVTSGSKKIFQVVPEGESYQLREE